MVNGAPRRSVPVGAIRRLGDHALLVGVEGPLAARTLTRAIHASGVAGAAEVVGGLATVMVAIDPEAADLGAWRRLLARLLEESAPRSGEVDDGTCLLIPCTFDGPDLDEVADLVGCTPETVVALVTDHPLTVSVVGFSPGFAYLDGLAPELCEIPRRSRPRPAVAPGSVALANGHAAVYPTASPGGWQLIGRTEVQLFTPWEAPYARLAPGDGVQFTQAPDGVTDGSSPPSILDSRLPGPSTEDSPSARPVFVVEEAGLRTVPQDGGRRGLAALGVPAASPGDPVSFRLANQLVGNPVGACALEVTARGPTLSCVSSTFVAVVGAAPDVRLQGQPVATGCVVPVNAGQRLVVGSVRGGLRSYVAIAGGLVGPEVFGSRSTDQLAALGPGSLTVGDRLWVAAMEPPLGDHLRQGVTAAAADGEPVSLRVVPGPHPEHFSAGALRSLASLRFTVEAQSNRVGLRLRPEPGGSLADGPVAAAELDSQGMVTGAVQMPPNGEPVILLTDHATLGGYPVIAVVAAVDHGKLGQCGPGATIVFDPIDHDEADALFAAQQRNLDSAVVGRYPVVVE